MRMFRFHTGSIKSPLPRLRGKGGKGFDSILVRLKVSCWMMIILIISVSIPYWFD